MQVVVHPKLVDQVQQLILAAIADGRLAPGQRIIQQNLAEMFRVSRQPVQQALLLLRDKGVLSEAAGRGLIVAPLDLDYVRNMYEVRSVIEGLAFRRSAEINAERARERGPALIEKGRRAAESGAVAAMIEADLKFHEFIYSLSQNPLIEQTLQAHWIYTQRVMAEVLTGDQKPSDVWNQHEEMLDAVIEGDGTAAETLSREHVTQAGAFIIAHLQTAPKGYLLRGTAVA